MSNQRVHVYASACLPHLPSPRVQNACMKGFSSTVTTTQILALYCPCYRQTEHQCKVLRHFLSLGVCIMADHRSCECAQALRQVTGWLCCIQASQKCSSNSRRNFVDEISAVGERVALQVSAHRCSLARPATIDLCFTCPTSRSVSTRLDYLIASTERQFCTQVLVFYTKHRCGLVFASACGFLWVQGGV